MNRKERRARIGTAPGRIEWVAWGGRRAPVREVIAWWTEPAAPWEGRAERRYVRLLLTTGAVIEIYREGDQWTICGVED